ncbi:MAG: hypothetical protein ACOCNC_12840 [Acetivibrio ethanolgignens]
MNLALPLKALMKLNEKENVLFKIFTFERFYHFPVTALLVVDIKQKKYRIKFGAHCTLSYALERCVTEFVRVRRLIIENENISY